MSLKSYDLVNVGQPLEDLIVGKMNVLILYIVVLSWSPSWYKCDDISLLYRICLWVDESLENTS